MHERSSGAVVFRRRNGQVEFLLIKQRNKRAGYWGFPRGHVEAGETDQQAAIREVREEVGLDVTLLDGFLREINYRPRHDTTKTIVLYLSKHSGPVKLEYEELMTYTWASIDQARRLLTIADLRTIVEDAYEFIVASDL